VEEEFSLQDRMALQATIHPVHGNEPEELFFALNEIAVVRGSLARVCRVEVEIGPSHLATFTADGLVVASPTGSTGYSFSAGGPIVDPTSRNLIVSPIAPYLSAIRSVVVSPRHTVTVRVVDAYDVMMSVDGREDRRLAIGDCVSVCELGHPIRLIEPVGATPFWDLLRQKSELLPS
jgi:NAD+ kinase